MTTPSTEKRPQLLGSDTPYVSSVIARLSKRPEGAPHTLCAHCPAAMWVEQAEPRCFCQAMKEITWTPKSATPVTQCDGRETAVAELKEATARLARDA